jgi:hypothetical protein
MSEKYQIPPALLLKGKNFLKVPLKKGDLGGSKVHRCSNNDFSDIL